jgi:uncharacterized protein (DUF58 family)
MLSACPPEILTRIADLELVARIIVEGLVSGLHRSPFHGYSAEFSQYRHYQPGDDLKYVDWKLVARTDRVYTKQFRETTNMAAGLVIDTSASMAFGSKLRYSTIVAAALAYVISRQGDAIGLMASADGREVFLPARAGRPHLSRVLGALSALTAHGDWNAREAIGRAAQRLKRRGMLIVLSDFYDNDDTIFAELRRASRIGHEIIMFQLMSREELEFPYSCDLEFADLETGQKVTVNADIAGPAYKDAIAAFWNGVARAPHPKGFSTRSSRPTRRPSVLCGVS